MDVRIVICRIEPASATKQTISAMTDVGCDVVRLNFSHGTSAVILSGETAAGAYPVQSVSAMAKIVENWKTISNITVVWKLFLKMSKNNTQFILYFIEMASA